MFSGAYPAFAYGRANKLSRRFPLQSGLKEEMMPEAEYGSERYDKDCVRIVRGGKIVGFFLRCADDRWSIVDERDVSVSKRRFMRAKDALHFINNGGLQAPLSIAQGMETGTAETLAAPGEA